MHPPIRGEVPAATVAAMYLAGADEIYLLGGVQAVAAMAIGTEILVIADDRADPFIVAVDLLSRAEHGPDSPAVLVTTSEMLARTVIDHVERLLPGMPTREFAAQAWRDLGEVVVVHDLAEAYAVADEYASEHVEVLGSTSGRTRRAGSSALRNDRRDRRAGCRGEDACRHRPMCVFVIEVN
jgi:sulfopropanediol 3-dehydrogenase